MISLTIQGRKIDVYPAAGPNRPVVYLNTFGREGGKVYQELQKMESPDFTLAAISGMDWNQDMTPWDCPPLSRIDKPCTGGADDFLEILTSQILPEVEKNMEGEPAWRGISGYSLAGLFAVYAIYRTDLFSRIASMSGSLWFPRFKEYIFSHDMMARPECMYFSLGDKECKSKNSYLKTVQDNTVEIQAFYEERGIDSVFVQNQGGHYTGGVKRTADGIDWILRRKGND